MPASGETMAEWVRHLTVAPRPRTNQTAGPSTIERAMSAVTTWHLGHPKPNMRGARAVLNAYRDRLAEQKAAAAQPRQATAALPTQIRAMLTGVDRTPLAGKRNATLVLLGFATAARVSEVVALDIAAVTEAEHGYDVAVYRKKVRKHTTNAVLYGSDPATCPVRALRAYLAALADAGRTEGPLFVRVDRWDRLAPPMTRHGHPAPAGFDSRSPRRAIASMGASFPMPPIQKLRFSIAPEGDRQTRLLCIPDRRSFMLRFSIAPEGDRQPV
ncbi:hypothetical protein [Streptomyces sp. NPDC048644]|uniref:hypothetical protein n=1 Tax=Streptomyces sp. NPDC048644 TaxID=3365582 RepID=UPI003719A7E9